MFRNIMVTQEQPLPGLHRRLVVCCDGTWNADDAGPSATNVVRMLRCIAPQAEDGTPQIVHYHPGVGTGDPLDHMLGGALGIGLAPAIRDTYAFLANNYAPGDEIFLFGFSRGAFTARSVAGLIGAIGLLHAREMGRFMDAWRWSQLPKTQRDLAALDRCFPLRARDVPIRCIGVWDTVGALGVPRNRVLKNWHPCAETYRFYDTSLGSHVRYAFQALAIDERREPFAPALWNTTRDPAPDQMIRQVWFAGVHADVGGGYADHGPADIPFVWMLAQVDPLLALDLNAIPPELDTTEPYDRGGLHESFEGPLWKWAGEKRRTVGPGASQYVHETVLERFGYRGYPTNPDFDFKALPVWRRDSFERDFAWSQAAPPPPSPSLPGRKPSLCGKVVGWLEGS
ncbi:hypothetical protein CCS01_16540 [Rhodopila globiformis]|uniref:T6SS Phospholipase effector Tle1-like catalytic domain-containing protein n=2 Tax=Rhodopila globiformis TaxID=1071 RepID=A0A2S6NB34_RHOGL|nr:hypothetical protein CCS01_16540 [Rhodopila globiformis]